MRRSELVEKPIAFISFIFTKGYENIFEAIKDGNIEVVQKFMKLPWFSFKNDFTSGWSCLYCSFFFNKTNIAKLLIKNGAFKNIDNLYDVLLFIKVAINCGDFEILRLIFENFDIKVFERKYGESFNILLKCYCNSIFEGNSIEKYFLLYGIRLYRQAEQVSFSNLSREYFYVTRRFDESLKNGAFFALSTEEKINPELLEYAKQLHESRRGKIIKESLLSNLPRKISKFSENGKLSDCQIICLD